MKKMQMKIAGLFKMMGAIVAALILAELFLKLGFSQVKIHNLWYSPGIHQPDEKHGFIFTPSYQGLMYHPDKTFFVPIELDENGFRRSCSPENDPKNIVFIGGRSMVFSYGLRDDQSLHHYTQINLKDPSCVTNTSWPGFDLKRNLHVYQDILEDKIETDWVVLFIYKEKFKNFESFPSPLGNPLPKEELFQYFDDLVIAKPKSPVASFFGRFYFDSYSIMAISRASDLIGNILEFWNDQIFSNNKQPKMKKSTPIAQKESGKRFYKVTSALRQHFLKRKTNLLVVFLHNSEFSYYENYIPKGIQTINLGKSVNLNDGKLGTIASGHYDENTMKAFGKAIAEKINK